MHVQWKTTWVKTAWRPRRSTNGGTILVGSTNSVLPPHVPASHLMIPRRIHSLLDVPSKPLSLASTARDSPGVHLDERRLRSSVMMVRRTMSACGDFFNKAELGSGVRVLEPLPVRYSNPEPKLSHPRDRHSSPHSRAACQCPCWLLTVQGALMNIPAPPYEADR